MAVKSRLWLALGVLLGMLCGLPVIRAQVQPGRPRFPGILVIASGKTATINNTLTLAGTDATTMTFPSTTATVARTDAAQTFAGLQKFSGIVQPISVATSSTAFTDADKGIQFGNEGDAGYSALIAGQFNVLYHVAETPTTAAGGIRSSSFMASNGSTVGNANSSGVRIGQLASYTGSVGLVSTGVVAWHSGTDDAYNAADLVIKRYGSNALGVINGSSAQRVMISNTTTTVATAGEWWKQDWQGTANQFRMGAVAGSSSGTNRAASWDYGDKLASATAAITVPATSGPIVMGGLLQAPYLQGTTIYSAAGTPLPTCNGSAEGSRAAVSDATLPTFLAAYTSGGAVHASVYCDGTSWKTD